MVTPDLGVDAKTIIVVFLLIAGVGFGIRPFASWLRELRASKPKTTELTHEIAVRKQTLIFYERMEYLLGMAGIQRSHSTTQREFAAEVGQWWEQLADQNEDEHAREKSGGELHALVNEVTSTFYDVRFGGATLDNAGQKSIEHALQRIQELLNAPPNSVETNSQSI